MSQSVLALKWRPKNFDEIIGQPHVVTTLKSSLQKNRLANAYLFSGPRGVGKTSTARILAKALNCQQGQKENPCGSCVSCIEISQSRCLDVIEIDGASNTGVEDVRVLRENVKFAPVAGRFKVYIIDEVHMLSVPAFNALLKTLEEPPEFVKFIFATTRPDKIPATVLSRCQRLDFRRISVMEIIAQLEKITLSEGIKVDKDVLFAVARASDGAMRDAESILDQLASFARDKIRLDDVISVLGIVEQEALFEVTDSIIRRDAAQALAIFSCLIEEGKDINLFLANLIEHLRNLMVARVSGADIKLIDLPQEICERLLKQAQAFSLEEIFSFFNILVNAQEMSRRLESARIPLEVALIRLAHDKKAAAPAQHMAEPVKKNEPAKAAAPEEKKAKKESPDSQPQPQADSHPKASIEDIRNSWQSILDGLAKIKMYLSSYLSEGEPSKVQGDTLLVTFPKSHSLHKESLEKKENKEIIEKIVSQLLGFNLRLSFILSEAHQSRELPPENSFLKSALDVFGGRVVKED